MPKQHLQKHSGSVGAQPATTIVPPAAIAVVVAIYFGSIFAGQFAVSVVPLLIGWSVDRTDRWLSSSVSGQFVFMGVVELITVMMLFAVMRYIGQRPRDIGLIRPRLRDAGVALLAYPPYFVLNAVSALAANALLRVDLDQPQQTGFEHAAGVTDLALTFFCLIILAPIVEEIVMRGFLFSNLKGRVPVLWAAIVTSIVFSVAHLQFGSGAPLLWSAAIDTFVLSLVLCYIRQKLGSLWPGIGLHAIKNGLAFYVIFILPQLK